MIEDELQKEGKEQVVDGWSNEKMMSFFEEHEVKCPNCGKHNFTNIRQFGSVYGPAADVAAVWPDLVDCGLRSREERWVQPLLVAPRETGALTRDVVRRHPAMGWAAEGLHAATLGEEELVLPASVDMFTCCCVRSIAPCS